MSPLYDWTPLLIPDKRMTKPEDCIAMARHINNAQIDTLEKELEEAIYQAVVDNHWPTRPVTPPPSMSAESIRLVIGKYRDMAWIVTCPMPSAPTAIILELPEKLVSIVGAARTRLESSES